MEMEIEINKNTNENISSRLNFQKSNLDNIQDLEN